MCSQCLRNGAVIKTVHRVPFKLPPPPADKAAETKAPAAAPRGFLRHDQSAAPATHAGPPPGTKVRKRKRTKNNRPRRLSLRTSQGDRDRRRRQNSAEDRHSCLSE